ncbi:MAG TPA: hypothetical protein VM242_00315 [Acidimicrobiales bacterium]|nr:hypothetical protein [Acidimicrobiales bacterium]
MEPPGADVRGGPEADEVGLIAGPLRLGAAAAAAALALTSSGEVVLLACLLALVAADVRAGAAAAAALLALAVRWGSTSLDAISGAQSVLGPGATLGSPAEVAASWSAAAALVLSAPPGWWPAVAFGSTAALAVAGTAGGPADVALRLGAAAAGVAVTVAVGRRLAPGTARPAAVVAGGAALVLAVLG